MSIFPNPDEGTTVNERVQQLIDHYKLNRSSFSKAIGLSNNMTVTNIVGGRKNNPSYEVLRKIAATFPVNPSWLLMGKAPMLLDGTAAPESDEDSEVDTIAKAILKFPEKFEKNLIFAKYLESKCGNAIIEHQEKLILKMPQMAEAITNRDEPTP
ncbi:MAG: helix-turn-helix transcriptional regulator [Bacteroidota bacterium]